MTQVQKHSDLEEYLDSVYTTSHSTSTVSNYKVGITKFQKFLREKYDLNEIELVSKVKAEELDIYKIFRDWIVALDKAGYKPKSLRVCVPAVKGYLRYLGIKIYTEDFRTLVKMPRIILVREEGLTKDMVIRVLRNAPAKLQTVILVAIASGMRLGEIVQLKISDIDFESNPTRIRVRGETSKGRENRETFLTSEATKSLKDYLKRFFGWKEGENNEHLKDKPIFGRISLVKTVARKTDSHLSSSTVAVAENVLQKMLEHTLKNIPELNKVAENGRRVIHFHAFRKYFRTVVGNEVSRDYAEAVMGHHFYLDTYYALSEDKRREMYLQAEPYLTISDFVKVERNLKEMSEKYNELEDKFKNMLQHLKKNNILVPDSLWPKLQ